LTTFEATRTVRFSDCDPAGIVFFPRYMVMVNKLVERWFDDALLIPYASIISQRRIGLPTVRLEVDFTAVTRHGERLLQRLAVEKLGRTSLVLRHEYLGGDELRMRARQVLVCTALDTHRPLPLPEDMRSAMRPYLEDTR
jgi:4-hydroxybenzoyl-CoA thioesterase